MRNNRNAHRQGKQTILPKKIFFLYSYYKILEKLSSRKLVAAGQVGV